MDEKRKAYVVTASADKLPLKDDCIQMVVCSPPYWGLRVYDGEQGKEPYGNEPTVDGYVSRSVTILREIRRVLRPDGICFWNVGDSYARDPKKGSRNGHLGLHRNREGCDTASLGRGIDGLKPKDLALVPARVALAAQADGWWLRSDIIWEKGNPQPSSASDRPSDVYEHIFMLTKRSHYYWNQDEAKEVAQREKWGKAAPSGNSDWGKAFDFGEENTKREKPGPYRIKAYHEDKALQTGLRNLRDIWKIHLQPTPQPVGKRGHPATFPEELVTRCLKLASKPGDYVLDPFGGSGTTARVALEMGRVPIHSDLAYHDFAIERIRGAHTEERIAVISGPPLKLRR